MLTAKSFSWSSRGAYLSESEHSSIICEIDPDLLVKIVKWGYERGMCHDDKPLTELEETILTETLKAISKDIEKDLFGL